MKKCKLLLTALFVLMITGSIALAQQNVARKPLSPEEIEVMKKSQAERLRNDFAGLARYQEDNVKIGLPAPGENRVVFIGDSITDGWSRFDPSSFAGKPWINRGYSGQTTPQMLIRFRADVIKLKPAVVVILAGINDIAGNTGPSTLTMIEDNLASMVDLAKANGIHVVLSSVLPAYDFPWNPGSKPAEKVVQLNAWIKEYAEAHGVIYLDYFTPMADEKHAMKAEYTVDGVHPNITGYKVMDSLVEPAIQKALAK